MVGRKHEANAHVGNAPGDLLWLQVDVDAQSVHHIRAAALAGNTAPTVLADLGARRRCHKHGAGGDIEGVGTVTTRAHDVHHVGRVLNVHLGAELAHDLRGGGDLANGFLLHAQAGDDGGGHHGRELAVHDEPHQVQHLVVEDFAVFNRALQRFLGGDGHGVPAGCGVVTETVAALRPAAPKSS